MIEAYTIGIRLALDDGVSSHIQAIRQDLAAIDHAVDVSGTRIRDLARLGRGLMVPEQSMQVDANRENVAPVPDERATAKGDRRLLGPSSEGEDVNNGNRGIRREQAAFDVASQPRAAIAPQPSSRPAVSVAPREESPSIMPAAQLSQANRLPETPRSFAPDRQPTNLADLGRATLPANATVLLPNVRRPIAEIAGDSGREPKPIFQPVPETSLLRHLAEPETVVRAIAPLSPAHDVSDLVRAGGPATIAAPGPVATAPILPPWTAVISASEPKRPSGSIAPSRATGIASGLTIPAPATPGSTAEPSGDQPSTPQGPAHGELVIDGQAIGRWISDHLADQVVRPHSGFSGMDPRLSPVWPGVASSG